MASFSICYSLYHEMICSSKLWVCQTRVGLMVIEFCSSLNGLHEKYI